jgi:hypothetical protein
MLTRADEKGVRMWMGCYERVAILWIVASRLLTFDG